jgi:hypothetical protein
VLRTFDAHTARSTAREEDGMTTWTEDELDRVGAAGEIEIVGARADGLRRDPVVIWGVRVGDDYFVRSVRGVEGGWFRGTRATHRGWISVDGTEKDVAFEDVAADDPVNDAIDEAYRAKYGAGSIAVDRITNETARRTTLRVLPA